MDVLGFGLLADQDQLLTRLAARFRGVGVEDDLARSRAGRGGKPLGQRRDLAVGDQGRDHQLFEQRRVYAQQRLFSRDQTFLLHLDRGDDHRPRVHLAVARLQRVEAAAFDRELEVLDFVVVGFELVAQLDQLPVQLRHLFGHPRDRLRCADAGHDVFALGVDEVFAEGHVLAGRRVAGEADPGRRVIAHVAEHHRADIDRGAVGHVLRDLELAAVINRPLAHPGAEDRRDRVFELGVGFERELLAGLLLDDLQIVIGERFQVIGGEIDVLFGSDALLDRVHRLIETFIGNAHGDLAEQLDEATPGIVTEARVVGARDQALQRFGVQAEVQDRVHHARHRHRRARADRDQQRVAG